jgi:hypothetical protein
MTVAVNACADAYLERHSLRGPNPLMLECLLQSEVGQSTRTSFSNVPICLAHCSCVASELCHLLRCYSALQLGICGGFAADWAPVAFGSADAMFEQTGRLHAWFKLPQAPLSTAVIHGCSLGCTVGAAGLRSGWCLRSVRAL